MKKINQILVITLSNPGDVILTFPAIDILKEKFPGARLSVMVGPRAEGLFQGNPHIRKVLVFDKRQKPYEQFQWILNLRQEKFDLVVDLRHTAIPLLLRKRYCTPICHFNFFQHHMKKKHLKRLRSVLRFKGESRKRSALFISDEDERYIEEWIGNNIPREQRFFVVGPGAASHIKRWREDHFAAACQELMNSLKVQIVFVGDQNDVWVVSRIIQRMKNQQPLDLSGKTMLPQLAALLKRSSLVIVNDSAILHMASYLDRPVVAIFGPTNERKYGPWSSRGLVVRKKLFCSPCEQSACAYHHECMADLEVKEVVEAVRRVLLMNDT